MRYQTKLLDHLERTLWELDPDCPERSLVDTVLLACDLSEDAMEIDDLVSGVIERRTTRVLPRQRDPMLSRSLDDSPPEPGFEHAWETRPDATQPAGHWDRG